MKVLTGLKITPVAPDTNSVWLTGNTLRYFNNGAWQQVGGNSFRFNMPQTLMAPILNPVSLSPTDIHLNYDILNKSTDEYISTASFFLIPAATDTNAGAYPAAHYTKVESIPNNLNETLSGINTTLSTKADLVNGIVPASQLPTNVDIIRGTAVGYNSTTGTATGFNDVNGNPVTPDLNVQYFGQTTNLLFIYNPIDSLYHAISGQLALGEASSTAYRGDRGKLAYDHISDTNNPHQTTKSQVGLGNVDNTSDVNKPVSTAQQVALNSLSNSLNTSIGIVSTNSASHIADIANPHKTKLSFGTKFSVTGLNITINDGTTYNLMQLINLGSSVVFSGNMNIANYTIVNAGTANAVLKLPNINSYVSYTISVRLMGTIGTGLSTREFFVDLRRADNTVVEGKQISKTNSSALDRRGISLESASLDSSDNFITNGIKLIIDNPTVGSSPINLTGVEILIKGSY